MNSISDDIYWVRKLREGDIVAFDTIYRKYSVKLFNFGLKILRSEAESEELVQSVFIKLWENHKKLNPELSFNSYLFTIAYNDICKIFRNRKYLKKFVDETLYENINSSFNLSERIDYKSLLEHVHKIINELPERQKIIFLKSREEGKTTKEIAAELGLSPGTVDNYISESLKFIRRHINKNELFFLMIYSTFFF